MINKSKTIAKLALMLIASACSKQQSADVPARKEQAPRAVITTKVSGTGSSAESAVSDLHVYVFDAEGNFEIMGSGDGSSLELGCSVGRKTIWALAGAPTLNPSSETELLSTLTRLEDNSPASFVMSGSRSIELVGPANVDIALKRYVAKVSLGRVINALSGTIASKELIIRAVYLLNVAADTSFGLSSPTNWYNRMGKEDNPADVLISSGSLSVQLPSGDGADLDCVFYPYPNPTESNANGGSWSARHTKLVVEASIGGEICYYPIVLPVLQRNRTYTISDLTITMFGSDNPDIPIDKGTVNFSILVEDWETGQAPHSETI